MGCRAAGRLYGAALGHVRLRGNSGAPKGCSAAPRPGARPRAAARLAPFRPLRRS